MRLSILTLCVALSTSFSAQPEAVPTSTVPAAAAEAGMSRIYGGIHFMSANEHGLLCGAQLGGYVAENFLLPRPGKSQRGH